MFKRKEYFFINKILILIFLVLVSACKNGGIFNKITISNLVDPDKTVPLLAINSTPVALSGDHDYILSYDAFDNSGGSGIRRVEIYYSPDGNINNFKYIGNGPAGTGASVPICIPNKNHTQPTFKIIAIDKANNKTIKLIGDQTGLNYSINTNVPTSPNLTSIYGLITNHINTQLQIPTCNLSQCSAASLKYEPFPINNTYLLFNKLTQPLVSDAQWVSCNTILSNKFTVPDFTVEGPYNYNLWTKTVDTEFDQVTPIELISSSASNITVTYDTSAPGLTINPIATVGGGIPNKIIFTASDPNGVAKNTIFYAEDGVNFVFVADNVTSPYLFTPPIATVPSAKIKIVTVDNAGNSTTTITPPFNVDSTPPLAPIATLHSPFITSLLAGDVSVADCNDRSTIFVTESPIAPDRFDIGWQACNTTAGAITYSLTGPATQGIHHLYAWGKDAGGNISPFTIFDVIYDTTNPAIILNTFGTLYKGGDNITLNFNTTDANGVGTFTLEYSPDGTTYSLLSNLATNATSYSWTIPIANTSLARFRLTSVDNATPSNSFVLVSPNFTIDTTPPDTSSLFVEGTVISGKSAGTYRINDCSDVAKVKIVRGGSSAPLSTDPGWQPCSQAAYTLLTNDFIVGANNLKFWIKDGAENVAPAYLPFTTTYTPPTFNVVGGPTISHPIADITIQFCDEAGISKVLFNETGTQPISADVNWQSCSTAVGALKSASLSPGAHTLKAFFKYNDGIISLNPLDVYVNYTATLVWFDTPSVNRPQTRFTLATCAGIDKIFLNKSTAPLVTDVGWQACTTTAGGLVFDGLTPGVNTVNVYFKDATGANGVLFSNSASATATYIPPQATLNNGTTIQDTTAKLTISDCKNISKVLVAVDSATIPTSTDPNWVNCSTANNAISSPVLVGLGAHTLYTWFKFTDNYILPDPDIDAIVFDPYDVTPPSLNNAGHIISLTLDNGYGASPYLLVKNKLTYIDPTPADHVSRAEFTMSTCDPTGSADPKESITSVLVTTNSNIGTVTANDPYWQACNTTAKGIQSASLADSADRQLYFYYKDASGNIAGFDGVNTTQTVHVKIDTALDVTPPPRPYVEITTPPTLTSSPAQMWVNDVG